VLTEHHTDTLEWILYSLLCIALMVCMYDLSSISDISAAFDGTLSISADIALRNTFVIIVSYFAGYATNLTLEHFS